MFIEAFNFSLVQEEGGQTSLIADECVSINYSEVFKICCVPQYINYVDVLWEDETSSIEKFSIVWLKNGERYLVNSVTIDRYITYELDAFERRCQS